MGKTSVGEANALAITAISQYQTRAVESRQKIHLSTARKSRVANDGGGTGGGVSGFDTRTGKLLLATEIYGMVFITNRERVYRLGPGSAGATGS